MRMYDLDDVSWGTLKHLLWFVGVALLVSTLTLLSLFFLPDSWISAACLNVEMHEISCDILYTFIHCISFKKVK